MNFRFECMFEHHSFNYVKKLSIENRDTSAHHQHKFNEPFRSRPASLQLKINCCDNAVFSLTLPQLRQVLHYHQIPSESEEKTNIALSPKPNENLLGKEFYFRQQFPLKGVDFPLKSVVVTFGLTKFSYAYQPNQGFGIYWMDT